MRILFYGDSHFKEFGSATIWNKITSTGLTYELDNLIEGFRFVRDKIIELNPDLLIFTGDLFHPMETISIRTLYGASLGMELVSRACKSLNIDHLILRGNHDTLAETPVIINSISSFGGYGTLITEPYLYDLKGFGIKLIPHYSNKAKILSEMDTPSAQLIVPHTEFAGAKFENGHPVEGGLDGSIVKTPIISGHIHMPQQFGNVIYVGSLVQDKFYKVDGGSILMYDTDTNKHERIKNTYSKDYLLVDDIEDLKTLDPKRYVVKVVTSLPRQEVEELAKGFDFIPAKKTVNTEQVSVLYTETNKLEDPGDLLRSFINRDNNDALSTFDRVMEKKET